MNHSSSNSSTVSPVWCAAFSAEGLLILVSNIGTIITFLLHKHLRKRSVFLLINLSVADLLVGLIPVPLYVYFFATTSSTALQLLTYIYTYLDIFLGLTSIVTLACISLERMRATVWPLSHRSTTNSSYSGVIAMTWMFAASIAGVTIYIKVALHEQYDIYAAWLSVSILLVSLCIILTSYSIVFASFKRSTKRNSRVGHTCKTVYRENRLAITVFIVTMASMLAWVPFIVLNGIHYYSDIQFTQTTKHLIKLLHYMNSLTNTFIYASRMQDFKRALLSLVCKCRRYHLESPNTTKRYMSTLKNGDLSTHGAARKSEKRQHANGSDTLPILDNNTGLAKL